MLEKTAEITHSFEIIDDLTDTSSAAAQQQ
jgi:putative redox protein